MRGRWAGEPRWLRIAAGILVAVLLWGCGQHVADLLSGGFDAYAGFPGWMAGYWTALTLLDPLAALFVAARHRLAWLAPAILVTDGLVNLYAQHLLAEPLVSAPLAILLLGLATTVLSPRLIHRDQGTQPR